MLKFLQDLLTVSVIILPTLFYVLQCIVLTNIVSGVRVSLSEKPKDRNLKESIEVRVRTEG